MVGLMYRIKNIGEIKVGDILFTGGCFLYKSDSRYLFVENIRVGYIDGISMGSKRGNFIMDRSKLIKYIERGIIHRCSIDEVIMDMI